MLANVRTIRLFYVVIFLKSSKWWKKHLISLHKSYEFDYFNQWLITFWMLEDFMRPIWIDQSHLIQNRWHTPKVDILNIIRADSPLCGSWLSQGEGTFNCLGTKKQKDKLKILPRDGTSWDFGRLFRPAGQNHFLSYTFFMWMPLLNMCILYWIFLD